MKLNYRYSKSFARAKTNATNLSKNYPIADYYGMVPVLPTLLAFFPKVCMLFSTNQVDLTADLLLVFFCIKCTLCFKVYVLHRRKHQWPAICSEKAYISQIWFRSRLTIVTQVPLIRTASWCCAKLLWVKCKYRKKQSICKFTCNRLYQI